MAILEEQRAHGEPDEGVSARAVVTTHRAGPEQGPPGCPGAEPGYVYEWVADRIAERIESGELTPYTALPGERTLAADFNVSLGTVRHATRLLRVRGLVVTVRSKGTYVSDLKRK